MSFIFFFYRSILSKVFEKIFGLFVLIYPVYTRALTSIERQLYGSKFGRNVHQGNYESIITCNIHPLNTKTKHFIC